MIRTRPSITREPLDDDGEVLGPATVGWDVSFGCRINFGPALDGSGLQVHVSVSDAAKRDGVAVLSTDAVAFRELATALEDIANEEEARRDTVDELAQAIRTIDGNHMLGAGALAEALVSAGFGRRS